MKQFVTGIPNIILRLEGISVFVLGLISYYYLDQSWWIFIVFFFLPDISLLGYLIGNRYGSIIYNFAHSYVIPLLIISITIYYSNVVIGSYCIIWIAHIGFDRTLGYGLKYGLGFKYTHMGIIGKNSSTK